MRRFSSYGPVDTEEHYYVPREALIKRAYTELTGQHHDKGGHYITVWAPRQSGKTWIMQELVKKIKQESSFEVGLISVESLKKEKNEQELLEVFTGKLADVFQKEFPVPRKIRDIAGLFSKQYFNQPVILLIDEFDALEEDFINMFASVFRDIYISRSNEYDRKSNEKTNLLHGLALVGIRSVLGIENVTGSPFNIQRSVHIPNFTHKEVKSMFKWYESESKQKISQKIIQNIYEEFSGQPGHTCWFGELLTETYNRGKKNFTTADFEEAYAAAAYSLPNNNILNIISKVKVSPYREEVLALFTPGQKVTFAFDNMKLNYLYMNGVITDERVGRTGHFVRFSSPFVQKRLFNYFSNALFDYLGPLVEPFGKQEELLNENGVHIRNLLTCYNRYLTRNRDWLLKDAPRRKDLRIYEAVFHFNLYMYLFEFFKMKGGKVYPEFPTGNGKIDLLLHYSGRTYGLELKSYSDETAYKHALQQAARYAASLGLKEITLVFFVDSIDEANRQVYEKEYRDENGGTVVEPVFIETGPHDFSPAHGSSQA